MGAVAADVRRRLRPLLFSPRILGRLAFALRRVRPGREPRPFWGIVRTAVGGPAVRTRRMIAEFGNHLLTPNVIYAQSGWNADELAGAVAFRRAGRAPLVFNQNGWYYPGWYNGDWKAANAAIVEAQRAADLVLLQSQFCLEAGRALTGYEPRNYEVLHNAIPPFPHRNQTLQGDGRTVWLSAVFTPDSEHILKPAVQAMAILHRRHGQAAPHLLLAGRVDPATRTMPWFQAILGDIALLEADGGCRRLGEYCPDDLPRLASNADVALHLKYKDPCPNAVIERMALGLPHVFSNSGGTPELIGDAGIGLPVEDTWDRQVPVDPKALADAIEWALANRRRLSDAALEASRRFSWDAYVARHRAVFTEVLGSFH